MLRRYQRFLADVEWPNTASMPGCREPGSRIWLSRSSNSRRKYPLTWELVESQDGTLVGINTQRTNKLVREGLDAAVEVVL